MTPSVHFLQELANLLSKAGLYEAGHPAREEALEALHEACEALCQGPEGSGGPPPGGSGGQAGGSSGRPGGSGGRAEGVIFSFVDGEVILGDRPLPELKKWPWGRRFALAGVGRLELSPGASREEVENFVRRLMHRLGIQDATGESLPHPHIRFGALEVRKERGRRENGSEARALELTEESEAVRWIHEQVESSDAVPLAEAGAVVRGLLVALRGSRQLVAPLLHIKSTDQYTSAHCINVSILSMALAEYLQFSEPEVRGIGEAALLHDIGKTKIPLEVLNKPGKLTPTEREIIERHPGEGARLLLGSAGGRRGADELTAVVAYEHHMHWAGDGGYPAKRYERKPHRFSRLVQVCDVYDALRTRRPFRAPLASEAALEFLRQRAGSEFDPDFARAFREMMRSWEPSTVEREEEAGTEEKRPSIEVDELTDLPEGRYDPDTEAELYAG
ncbi:MAG: HD-GYP domain-containing protein [Gemmatimonadota bacterium]